MQDKWTLEALKEPKVLKKTTHQDGAINPDGTINKRWIDIMQRVRKK